MYKYTNISFLKNKQHKRNKRENIHLFGQNKTSSSQTLFAVSAFGGTDISSSEVSFLVSN